LGNLGEQAQSIDADHIGMVKFKDRNDNGYKKVRSDIEDLVQNAEKRRAEEAATVEEEKAKGAAPAKISGA
jgi:hypothetical protein